MNVKTSIFKVGTFNVYVVGIPILFGVDGSKLRNYYAGCACTLGDNDVCATLGVVCVFVVKQKVGPYAYAKFIVFAFLNAYVGRYVEDRAVTFFAVHTNYESVGVYGSAVFFGSSGVNAGVTDICVDSALVGSVGIFFKVYDTGS